MIIKKPYAFIIKYFKYIHLVFFLLLLYINYKYFSIFRFFNDYVRTGYYSFYENLSGHFINYYLFISTVIVIVFSAFLYLLMNAKKKNTKYYFTTTIYYLIIFGFSIFLFSTLKTLELKTIDVRTIRAVRDILMIVTFPQIYFTVFAFLRSVGFDLKSFDFKKDLEELNINPEDEEEIEILIPNDSYKYMRKFRRFIREVKYFALEYKFFFFVTLTVGLFSMFLILYLNIEVYDKKYKENDKFISESVKYQVKDSFITAVDYSGKIINENKSYVVISLDVVNMGSKKQKLNMEKLKLVVNGREILSTLSKGNYFVDIGKPYNNQYLQPSEEYNYLIIFEIDNEFRSSNYTFRIFTDVEFTSGEINSMNKNVIVYPENTDNLEGSEKYGIGSKISLGESNLSKSSITVKSFNINNSFEEPFNYCVEENCYQGIKKFAPSIIASYPKAIIRLECEFEIDEEKYIKKEVSNASDFISYFGSIYYTIDNKAKLYSIKVLKSENINRNKVFFEVPREVIDAQSTELYITVRNVRYIITLK